MWEHGHMVCSMVSVCSRGTSNGSSRRRTQLRRCRIKVHLSHNPCNNAPAPQEIFRDEAGSGEQALATSRLGWLQMASSQICLRTSEKHSINTNEASSIWATVAIVSALSIPCISIWRPLKNECPSGIFSLLTGLSYCLGKNGSIFPIYEHIERETDVN